MRSRPFFVSDTHSSSPETIGNDYREQPQVSTSAVGYDADLTGYWGTGSVADTLQ